MVITLSLFSQSNQLLAFGRKDREQKTSLKYSKKQGSVAPTPADIQDLPQVDLAGYPIEFTALVRITGNEPHTHAVLSDTETGKVYRVVPLESEKLLYSYQGFSLLVTGTILDEPEKDPEYFYDGTINPSGWKVQ